MACRPSHAKHIALLIHIPHNQYKKTHRPCCGERGWCEGSVGGGEHLLLAVLRLVVPIRTAEGVVA